MSAAEGAPLARSMNILFLSMTFPDAVHRTRGAYNFALCRELAREHRVRVVSPRPWPEVLRERLRGRKPHAGREIEAAGLSAAYPCYWYAPKLTQHQSGQILWRSCRGAVRKITREAPPDAVLSYWAHPDGEAGLRAARQAGAVAGVIVGGTDALILPHRPGRGPYVRRVLQQSDVVFTVSRGLRDAVIGLGVPGESVHVLTQGVDPKHFHPGPQQEARRKLGLPADGARLLWVGRMVDIKRLDVLLEACRRLRDRGRTFTLHLLGGGEEKPRMQRLAAELGLDEHVRFEGPRPHEETADWYRAADAAVLSSDSEGLPNVLRESLACGTPFVSTDVGSVREIAAPEHSLLTPPGDSAAFAEALEQILAPEFRAAAATYRATTWAETARDVADVFAELRQRRAAAGAAAPGASRRGGPRNPAEGSAAPGLAVEAAAPGPVVEAAR